MSSMRKTTIYLPDELKEDLAQASRRVGRSEAELIREAVGDLVSRLSEPRPRLPLAPQQNPPLPQPRHRVLPPKQLSARSQHPRPSQSNPRESH